MTPNEKLEHLRDWMALWIDCDVRNALFWMDNKFYAKEWGIRFIGGTVHVCSFDEYLNHVNSNEIEEPANLIILIYKSTALYDQSRPY